MLLANKETTGGLPPLKYERTQELIDLAQQGGDGTVYYCSGSGYRFTAGDGTPIVFYFDIPSAYWNAEDLNRIEEWTGFLRDLLDEYGYHIELEIKTDWVMADIPVISEINRLRSNVDALQNGFYSLPEWQEIFYENTIGFEQANAIEWDLHLVSLWLEKMVESFKRSGSFYSGQGVILPT